MNPKNTANNTAGLAPAWPKGVSGNPNGRPKKEFSLTQGMRDFLSEHDPDKKRERKDLLVEQTYKQAMRGDIAAIKMIFNYLEGMPKGSETQVAVQVNTIVATHEMKKETILEYVQKSFSEEDKEELKNKLAE